MTIPRRQILTLVLCGVLLQLIVAQVNHALGPYHLGLWLGGLFVTFAALRIGYREGLIVVLLLGWLQDAAAPVAFGLHALLFATAHAVVVYIRNRFPREETVVGVLVALLANLSLYLLMSFSQIGDSPAPGQAWSRIFVELIASQLSIALIAPWYLALQESALDLAGAGLRTEQRGVM